MSKIKLIRRTRKGLGPWFSYWRESLNAGQEKHDFMLYTLVTLAILVAIVLTLSGFSFPTWDVSDALPHKLLAAFEMSLIIWILLYLPYKRHMVEKKEHSKEIDLLRAKIATPEAKNTNAEKLGQFHIALTDKVIEINKMGFLAYCNKYPESVEKKAFDPETSSLLHEIEEFLKSTIGGASLAVFKDFSNFKSSPTPNIGFEWKKQKVMIEITDNLNHFAGQLMKIIEKYTEK